VRDLDERSLVSRKTQCFNLIWAFVCIADVLHHIGQINEFYAKKERLCIKKAEPFILKIQAALSIQLMLMFIQ
jgi:hypothetical protein